MSKPELSAKIQKITKQSPQGQYAYWKYLEIIRAGVFESE